MRVPCWDLYGCNLRLQDFCPRRKYSAQWHLGASWTSITTFWNSPCESVSTDGWQCPLLLSPLWIIIFFYDFFRSTGEDFKKKSYMGKFQSKLASKRRQSPEGGVRASNLLNCQRELEPNNKEKLSWPSSKRHSRQSVSNREEGVWRKTVCVLCMRV